MRNTKFTPPEQALRNLRLIRASLDSAPDGSPPLGAATGGGVRHASPPVEFSSGFRDPLAPTFREVARFHSGSMLRRCEWAGCEYEAADAIAVPEPSALHRLLLVDPECARECAESILADALVPRSPPRVYAASVLERCQEVILICDQHGGHR